MAKSLKPRITFRRCNGSEARVWRHEPSDVDDAAPVDLEDGFLVCRACCSAIMLSGLLTIERRKSRSSAVAGGFRSSVAVGVDDGIMMLSRVDRA